MSALGLALLFAACGEDAKDPCAGVECGEGRCVADSVGARCDCEEGFVDQHLTCVPEDVVPPDMDGDGVVNEEDDCPAYPDPEQRDDDSDDRGDACQSRAFAAREGSTIATWLRSGRVVFTGANDGEAFLLQGHVYDPTDDSISRVANDPQHAHSGGTAVTLPDGRALFAGGEEDAAPTPLCDLFDEVSGFRAAPPMAEGRSFFGSTLLADGRFFVAGGMMGEDTTGNTEIFDGDWTAGPPLDGPKGGGVAAVLLDDGNVLLTGGFELCDGVSGPSNAAMIWNPTNGHVAPAAGSMTFARWGHTMARLWDGRVVVSGGTSTPCGAEPFVPVAAIEVFDPETGLFEVFADGADHFTGALVPLADGSALALGGFDPSLEGHTRASRLRADGLATEPPFEAEPLAEPHALCISGAVLLFDGSVFIGPAMTFDTGSIAGAERIFPYYDTAIDADLDGVIDVRDDCPDQPNPDQSDGDDDGVGDACE